MALLQFKTVMPQAVDAVVKVARGLRSMRDGIGDLPLRDRDLVQQQLHAAKIQCIKALTEAQADTVEAETFMASLGGPVTLADFQAGLAEIEGKAAAWNAFLKTWSEALPATVFEQQQIRTVDGADAKHFGQVRIAPMAMAITLRQSQELGDLIAAFEAVGA